MNTYISGRIQDYYRQHSFPNDGSTIFTTNSEVIHDIPSQEWNNDFLRSHDSLLFFEDRDNTITIYISVNPQSENAVEKLQSCVSDVHNIIDQTCPGKTTVIRNGITSAYICRVVDSDESYKNVQQAIANQIISPESLDDIIKMDTWATQKVRDQILEVYSQLKNQSTATIIQELVSGGKLFTQGVEGIGRKRAENIADAIKNDRYTDHFTSNSIAHFEPVTKQLISQYKEKIFGDEDTIVEVQFRDSPIPIPGTVSVNGGIIVSESDSHELTELTQNNYPDFFTNHSLEITVTDSLDSTIVENIEIGVQEVSEYQAMYLLTLDAATLST